MSSLQDWETLKKERRRLRGQQRRLNNNYVKAVQEQNLSRIETFKDNFLDCLEVEKRVSINWIEPERYPLFFDNVFKALGFGIYRGTMPTVSDTQPSQPFHIAFDASRFILMGSFPSSLFAEIADLQPLSSRPLLGISHTTWARPTDDWERRYTRISTALGIGRLRINSPDIIKTGIQLDPEQDATQLGQIAVQIGLTDFLCLPVDNLPIYGTFRIGERQKNFDEKTVKRMLFTSIEHGHQLSMGAVTSVQPLEALENPTILIRELGKADLIEGTEKIVITPSGERYVNERLVGTAQEAALVKTADFSIYKDLRLEFRSLERRLDDSISNSKNEILGAIKEVKIQIKEREAKHNISAKYIIDLPPGSPLRLRVEIPIGEMSDEDIFLKVAEIKVKVQGLPSYLIAELRNSIESLPKVPQRIKDVLLRAF